MWNHQVTACKDQSATGASWARVPAQAGAPRTSALQFLQPRTVSKSGDTMLNGACTNRNIYESPNEETPNADGRAKPTAPSPLASLQLGAEAYNDGPPPDTHQLPLIVASGGSLLTLRARFTCSVCPSLSSTYVCYACDCCACVAIDKWRCTTKNADSESPASFGGTLQSKMRCRPRGTSCTFACGTLVTRDMHMALALPPACSRSAGPTGATTRHATRGLRRFIARCILLPSAPCGSPTATTIRTLRGPTRASVHTSPCGATACKVHVSPGPGDPRAIFRIVLIWRDRILRNSVAVHWRRARMRSLATELPRLRRRGALLWKACHVEPMSLGACGGGGQG